MYFSRLENRALITVSGDDAETFLDNLITCKIIGLETDEASFGALLTPQGKIMFDFFLIKTGSGFLIDTDRSLGEELTKRLTFYKLRAKVDIKLLESRDVIAFWGDDIVARDHMVSDPRHSSIGSRLYNDIGVSDVEGDYHAHRIAIGVPQGGIDFQYGDAYPHETLMDQFGGIDFKKGCYVGQEVVSRMQHRGTAKKRIIHIESGIDLPEAGTPIVADGKPAGTIGSVNGKTGLALLRLDRVAKAEKLEADGVSINARIQDWVNFDFPESG